MPRCTPTEVRRRATPRRRESTHHGHDRDTRATEHERFRDITEMLRERRSARPVPLSVLIPGTVVWANVPWRESAGGKVRPAVVVTAGAGGVDVFGLSSMRPWRAIVALPEDEPFLSGPSGCLLHRSHIDRTDIVSRAGILSPLNRATVDAVATTLSMQARLHLLVEPSAGPPPPASPPPKRPPVGGVSLRPEAGAR